MSAIKLLLEDFLNVFEILVSISKIMIVCTKIS